MKPEVSYKPKTTIIQANPGFWHKGYPVVAWVIEDGQVTAPVTLSGELSTIEFTYDTAMAGGAGE